MTDWKKHNIKSPRVSFRIPRELFNLIDGKMKINGKSVHLLAKTCLIEYAFSKKWINDKLLKKLLRTIRL